MPCLILTSTLLIRLNKNLSPTFPTEVYKEVAPVSKTPIISTLTPIQK